MRELLAQQIRHRPPALLVDDVGRLGDRRPVHRARVPRDRNTLRAVVGQQLEEHVGEAEQRVGRLAVARRQLLREREERTVGQVVAVDEEQLAVARGRVVELQLGARERLRHQSNGIVRRRCRSFETEALSDAHREECAALARRALCAPTGGRTLLPDIEDFAAHVPGIRRGGRDPRRQASSPTSPARWTTASRRCGFAGCAASEPEAIRDCFARHGGRLGYVPLRGRRPGVRRRPRRRLVPARLRLPVHVGGARDRAGRAGRLRRQHPVLRRRDDLDALASFDKLLWELPGASRPSFSGLEGPPLDEFRAEWSDTWDAAGRPMRTSSPSGTAASVGHAAALSPPDGRSARARVEHRPRRRAHHLAEERGSRRRPCARQRTRSGTRTTRASAR